MRRTSFVLVTCLLVGAVSACAGTEGKPSDDGDGATAQDASGPIDAARDAGVDDATTSDGKATTDADAMAAHDASSDDSGTCADGGTRACTTSCASTGTASCASGQWGPCVPPGETCNLADDDCSGACDDILGCRIGVDRSYDSSTGQHLYTTTDSEASCCGNTVETQDYYFLYDTQATGTVPFYRCRTATGYLDTTDPSCEGQTLDSTLGYIATSAVCGALPLYRLHHPTSGDNFYTTSAAESASAQSSGYTLVGTSGYVWAADCGGSSCTWPSPIEMVGSTLATVTGFPTAWYGFPIAGTQSVVSLSGSVSVTNTANLYAEVLFILQYLPSGTCTSGPWPSSTPEYGPPDAQPIAQFIVKAPAQGTFTVPIDLTLPGGLPVTSCILLGLNGGAVGIAHDVTSAATLALTFTGPETPTQGTVGVNGEFCFGQDWGCQAATTDDSQSFANVTPISQASQLVALYGDISDSTFDGTATFAGPPAGSWTASNDFYVYRGSDCAAFGVASGTVGPGSYYASIPTDATHLLSAPQSGSGIGVSEGQVFQSFSNVTLNPGDCFVTLWGLQGGGGFDNETQVFALTAP